MPGAKDHPLLSRYAGSTLQNASTEAFAAVRIPAGPGRHGADGKLAFDKATTVLGRVSAYFYVQPKERSALEVFRNDESALSQAGFSVQYSCEMQACDQALIREPFPGEAVRPSRPTAATRGAPGTGASTWSSNEALRQAPAVQVRPRVRDALTTDSAALNI